MSLQYRSIPGRIRTPEVLLATSLVLLVAVAGGAHAPVFLVLMLAIVALALVLIRHSLPEARQLPLTVAICLFPYIDLFAAAVTSVVPNGPAMLFYGCAVAPIAALSIAVHRRREHIAVALADGTGAAEELIPGLVALMGAGLIAFATTIAMNEAAASPGPLVVLLIGTAALTIWVWMRAGPLIILLTETGMLFAVFVKRMIERLVPVFSFALVFCLLAFLFGTLYAGLDRLSGHANFVLNGTPTRLDLGEALYGSIVTLSTIGYGDITPITGAGRTLVAGEALSGVVLLVFAFAEIAGYKRPALPKIEVEPAEPAPEAPPWEELDE